MERAPDKRINEDKAKFYAFSIANALAYLHERNILCHNINSSKVLMDEEGFVYLGGFGKAVDMSQEGESVKTPI